MTRVFHLIVNVNEEFASAEPESAEAYARKSLTSTATRLYGPRGGRYKAVGPVTFTGWEPDPLQRLKSYGAAVRAKYVRPRHG